VDDDGSPTVTHTAFVGGKYSIPPEEMPVFLDLYALAVPPNPDNAKEPFFLVERRTPVYKFICDLDFEGLLQRIQSLQQGDEIEKGIAAIQRLLSRWFLGNSHVVVCHSSGLKDRGNGKFKFGVHLIWPTLLVTRTQGLQIRLAIIHHLREEGLWKDFDIESVVDKVVLEGNGFRMIGSYKTDPCPQKCRGPCGVCMGKGKLLDDRTYRPTYVVDGNGMKDNGAFEDLVRDHRKMMERLSIRIDDESVCPNQVTKDATEGAFASWLQDVAKAFKARCAQQRNSQRQSQQQQRDVNRFIPDLDELHRIADQEEREMEQLRRSNVERIQSTRCMNQQREILKQCIADDPNGAAVYGAALDGRADLSGCITYAKQLDSQSTECLSSKHVDDGTLLSMLSDFVANSFHGNPKATGLSCTSSNVWVVSTDCKWCSNVHREHSSNNIYITLCSSGARQKCHNSKWDAVAQGERKQSGVRCCDFRSAPVAIPDEIMERLGIEKPIRRPKINNKRCVESLRNDHYHRNDGDHDHYYDGDHDNGKRQTMEMRIPAKLEAKLPRTKGWYDRDEALEMLGI
jgi:hypothetical protein